MHDNWQAIWQMITLCPNDEEGEVEAATLPFFQLDFCGLMWYLFVWNWIIVQYYKRRRMLWTMMNFANYQLMNSKRPSIQQFTMQFQRTGWLQLLTQKSEKVTTGWLLVNTFRLPNLTALIISIPRLRSIWPSMNCAAACADRMQRHGLKRASSRSQMGILTWILPTQTQHKSQSGRPKPIKYLPATKECEKRRLCNFSRLGRLISSNAGYQLSHLA